MEKYRTSPFNITYYLGAGASAEALPVVNTLPKNFRLLSKKIEKDADLENDNKNYRDKQIKSLINLADKAEQFGTIDTYAKYLHLKDRMSLLNLKETLSFYFLYEQLLNNCFDKRALIFLTTILQYDKIFPPNIKIITWNYDFQIQIAAKHFVKEEFENTRTGAKHLPPLIEYHPSLGHTSTSINEQCSLVHLNGIAGAYNTTAQNWSINDHIFRKSKPENLNDLLTHIHETRYANALMKFGWEEKVEDSLAVKHAKKIMAETDILVVIGYTFPFFNREIDKEVFSGFKANSKHKKIYYQDKTKTGDFLKNQFELSADIQIKSTNDVYNYFIPLEL
ncbi:hypothetical protein [Limnovirga soli]|uniref:SIR2-like domain-containing protein n=1 Tax=Limnovirga soli TaxID=2656915 RepID=A0A8J8JSU2_9BACT|nr:hypothetical protein [Limnovirga soli]NNV53959.1 hypothetical protein [Limnovirga soli]